MHKMLILIEIIAHSIFLDLELTVIDEVRTGTYRFFLYNLLKIFRLIMNQVQIKCLLLLC